MPYAIRGFPIALASLSIQEILRVLRPGGRAILGTAKDAKQPLTQTQLSQWISGGLSAQIDVRFGQDAFGSWAEITKRQPKGMDAWSHWEHGPDNNPVSTDSATKAPYRTQWLGGLLVNRTGQVVVVHEDGSVSCFR